MFSIGLLAGRIKQPLVRLTNRYIRRASGSQEGFYLGADGRAYTFTGSVGYIAGEWYTAGATAGIGNSYEALVEVEAGTLTNNELSAWTRISADKFFAWQLTDAGRVKVSIRDYTTKAVLTAARIWNDNAYAP